MSFELFPQETANYLSTFGATQFRDPGAFEGFAKGVGMSVMRGFAEAGRAVSMVGSVGAVLQDTNDYGQRGTEAQDKYFKRHDEIFGRAVEYWTPKPREVGVAGDVVGQLLGTLPILIASPAALVAKTQLSTGESLVRQGIDVGKAQAVGAVQGAGLGLGVWLPIFGKTLAQRVIAGGIGANVVQGTATRAASAAILGGTSAADQFKTFDPVDITLDVLLGAAFGTIAHINPRMRAESAKVWDSIEAWGKRLQLSDVDALVTLKQAEHLNVESAPGRMATAEDISKHHAAMKQAIDDVLNDRPVNVDALVEGAKFLPDSERIAFSKAMVDELNAQAKGIVEAEMMAQVAKIDAESTPGFLRSAEELVSLRKAAEAPTLHPDLEKAIEIARKPGFMRTAEEKVILDAVMQGRAQDVISMPDAMTRTPEGGTVRMTEAQPTEVDPIRTAAEQFVADRPDVTLTIGRDQDGNPITVTAAKYLEDTRLDVELAAQDASLFEIAATCMLGGR